MPYAHSVKDLAKGGPHGRQAIYDAINSGALKAKKLGKRTLILDEDYQTWLRSLPAYEATNAGGRADVSAA